MPIQKSGKVFNDPGTNVPIKKSLETYLMILVSMHPYEKSLETFNDPRINVHIVKKVWKLI